jgi:hypothetical protein
MADEYSSYEELGRKVKSENPALTFSDRDAGLKFAKKFPHMVKVREIEEISSIKNVTDEPSWMNQFANMPTIPSPVDVFDMGMDVVGGPRLGEHLTNFTGGALSGASMGATKEVGQRLMGPQYGEGMMFGAGEIAGEVLGPFKLINKVLGPTAKAASQVRKIGRTAAESGIIEGGRGLTNMLVGQKDTGISDAAAQGAVGYVASGLVDAGLRGAFKGSNKLASKVFGVAEDEVNKAYMDFMRKHGQQILPHLAAPMSAIAARGQELLKESASSRRILIQTAHDLQKYTNTFKNNFLTRIGADPLTKSSVGKNVFDSVSDQRKLLHKESADIYNDLIRSNPKVQYMPINATKDIKVELADGTITEPYNIMQVLNDAVAGFKKGEEPAQLMRLKKKVDRLNSEHAVTKSVDTPLYSNRGDRIEQQFTPGDPTRRIMKRPAPIDPTDMGTVQTSNPADPDKFPMGFRQDTVIERMTYDDWWKELQGIGRLIGDSSKKPQVKKKLQRLYHRVQDAVDVQVMESNVDYIDPIKLARSKMTMYHTFRDNPVIDKILSLGGDIPVGGKPSRHQYSKVADEIFQDVDYIRDAKQVLSPEMFDMMRVSYLQDIVWQATELGSKELGTIERIDSNKLLSLINDEKKLHGLEGDFWKELFSDEGFIDAAGQPLAYKGQGSELFDQFKELVKLSAVTDVQAGQLVPGSEGFSSAMAERFALGSVVADPLAKMGMIKTLAANILATKRTAKEYLADPAENIFLKNKFISDPTSGSARQHLQSAVSNRLLGPAFGGNQ